MMNLMHVNTQTAAAFSTRLSVRGETRRRRTTSA